MKCIYTVQDKIQLTQYEEKEIWRFLVMLDN